MNNNKSVFISYSAKDKKVAAEICSMLESEGIDCWIAPRDVTQVTPFPEQIIDAIEHTRITVLLLSKSAIDSKYVKKEIQRAFEKGKTVIPFRIEDVEPGKALELFLAGINWIDAWNPPLEQKVKHLALSVKEILGLPTTPPPPPPEKPVNEKPSSVAEIEKRIAEGVAADKFHDQLFIAVAKAEVNTVKAILLEYPKLINRHSITDGSTLLTHAVFRSTVGMAKFLLDQGADVKAKNSGGQTAMHILTWHWNPDTAQVLIEKGADIMAADDLGITPLHTAVIMYGGQLPAAKYLLEHGALVNSEDAKGFTPLHHAVITKNDRETAVEMVELLLQKGADPNRKNKEGKTALQLAQGTKGVNQKAIIESLQKHGAAEPVPQPAVTKPFIFVDGTKSKLSAMAFAGEGIVAKSMGVTDFSRWPNEPFNGAIVQTIINAKEALQKLQSFVEQGGRAAILLCANYARHNSEFQTLFDISICSEWILGLKGDAVSEGKRPQIQGSEYCSLFDGLKLSGCAVTPSRTINDKPVSWFDAGIGCYLAPAGKEWRTSHIAANPGRCLSAWRRLGKGEILFLAAFELGQGHSFPEEGFLGDRDIDIAQNMEAARRLVCWLAGKAEYPVQ